MAFTPSINIPLGTYVKDGLRAGPSYGSGGEFKNDNNNNLIVGSYNKFGPGVLYSPTYTWNIVPYANTAGNIVLATAVPAAKYLTFSGDNAAATRLMAPTNEPYIQLDWPRVPQVVVAGAAMSGPTTVTIFGFDWWGFPLQMAINAIQATGTYPANIGATAKAFYQITSVYCDTQTGAGGTIAIQTSNIFGLPYVMKEKSYASNFSWNGTSMFNQSGSATLAAGTVTVNTPAIVANSVVQTSHMDANGTATANIGTTYVNNAGRTANKSFVISSTNTNDASIVAWTIQNGGEALIAPAFTGVSTATTGDVRGLVQIPDAVAPDGVRRLVLSYYVFGSDVFQNQLAAGDQPQGTGAVAPATNTVPYLNRTDLYGVDQYYTGAL